MALSEEEADWACTRIVLSQAFVALSRTQESPTCYDPRAPGGVPPLPVEGSSSGSAPTAFGPFRVLHQLGAGALGPVFRAHDPGEGRLVAIKTFRLDLTPEQAAAVARELDVLVGKRLTHPSIAVPLAAGLDGATPWLAQAYAPAESMDTAVRQYGPAPTAQVVTVVTHLAGALDFAAAAGVLHGSLHPRDVLVAPAETFLIDIGVAPALERCGIRPPLRRPYSAPERVAGGSASRASDVFALAALAFELMTGQPIAGTDDAVASTLPEIDGADDAALRELFSSALADDPAARPETALLFASAFKTALGSASFRAAPAVAPRRARRQTPVPDARLPLDGESDADSSPESAASAPTLVASSAPENRADDTPMRTDAPAGPISLGLTAAAQEAPESPLDRVTLHRAGQESHPAARPGRHQTTRASVKSVLSVRVLAGLIAAAAVVGFGIGWLATRLQTPSSVSSPSTPTPADRAESTNSPTPTETSGTSTPRAETEHVVPETPPDAEPPAVPAPAPKTTVAPPAAQVRPASVPEPVRGRLLVRSTPSGASVSLDGRARGETPLALRDLPLGGHTIVVSRPGYAPERRRVTLTRNRLAQTLTVPLRASSTAAATARRPERPEASGYTGTMVFESRPTGARVVLDGREVGRTPLVLPGIRAGSHVVRLELDGHRTWTAAVQVVAEQRNRVAASLEELTR
jgi:serine/threonine protein kinase